MKKKYFGTQNEIGLINIEWQLIKEATESYLKFIMPNTPFKSVLEDNNNDISIEIEVNNEEYKKNSDIKNLKAIHSKISAFLSDKFNISKAFISIIWTKSNE